MANDIDIKAIAKLAEIINKNNLTELEYEGETFRISLAKNHMETNNQLYVQTPKTIVNENLPNINCEKITEVETKENDFCNHPGAIKSPMVGVVYLSADPSTPNYVEIGDNVKEGDTVCLIEAMKTFSPVKATKSGKVTAIMVSSGDPVEYGEPLVIVE